MDGSDSGGNDGGGNDGGSKGDDGIVGVTVVVLVGGHDDSGLGGSGGTSSER